MPDLKHRDRLPTCDQEFARRRRRRRRDKLPQPPLSCTKFASDENKGFE
jgi:hypothetical protein